MQNDGMQAQREGDWCSEPGRVFVRDLRWPKLSELSNIEKTAEVGNHVLVMNMGIWQYLTAWEQK